MSKKRILFVMNNLNVGGAEKALVSLLNELDYSRLEVDLLLFKQEGVFLKEVPKEVNILPEPKNYRFFDGPFVAVLKTFNPKLIFARYWFKKLMQKGKNRAEAEQYSWKALRLALPKLPKGYDVAIGYLEKNPIYFVVEKVNAVKKIGFIHNDYRSLKLNYQIDEPYFEELDNICSVSGHCVEVLKQEFPTYSGKIILVPNLFSKKMILKSADEEITELNWDKNCFQIVSVGRLEHQKGFDVSIQTAAVLKSQGFKFKWHILGEGSERPNLEKQIQEAGLQEYFLLHGLQANPYKFLKTADLVVQTSRFEGKSIVIDEAKILNKLILITNYPTAKDQISDGQNGFITTFDPAEIATRIQSIAENAALRQEVQQYLAEHQEVKENVLITLF